MKTKRLASNMTILLLFCGFFSVMIAWKPIYYNGEFVKPEREGLLCNSTEVSGLPLHNNTRFDPGSLYCFTIEDSVHEKVRITPDNSKSKVSIPFVSWIDLLDWDRVQLVMDIPGKYLLKGDLIYALTLIPQSQGNFWWFPGHVGLYLGTTEPKSNINDGNSIIESTPDFNGVSMNNTFSTFKTALFHIYMGAHRFNGTTTNQNRIDIASYAISKLGTCFDMIDWWSNNNCISCVGLTEKAYKAAGLDILPTIFKIPFMLPLKQFSLTKPVNEIEVKAGDLVFIPVYGVVWNDSDDSYTKDSSAFTATASNLPDGASFTNNIFSWQPQAFYAGQIFDIKFKVVASSGNEIYSVFGSLKIKVVQTVQPQMPP